MKCLGIVPLFLLACGLPKTGQQPSAPARDGFQYEVAGESVAIVYESKPAAQPNGVDLQIQVNDHSFTISMSAEAGLQSFDGRGASLSHEERNALAQAALDYSKQQGISEVSGLEQKSLYLTFDYLSQAPDDFTFGARSYHGLNLQNEGIRCIRKGSSVKAQWSTRSAPSVTEDIVVGSNWPNNFGCMGRCGADCGWGAPSAWTKDCLDLDACVYRAGEGHCEDEYKEAADDWLGGVLAACHGK